MNQRGGNLSVNCVTAILIATYPSQVALLPRRTNSPSAPKCSWLLFSLAPHGVCHAVPVTRSAVSSYLTVSPLPSWMCIVSMHIHELAVYFLLHFPSACLKGHFKCYCLRVTKRAVLWSPDFPHYFH